MSRIVLAFKSFFSLLFTGELSDSVIQELKLTRKVAVPVVKPAAAAAPAAPKPVAASTAADGAVQMLSLLQREARLIDFFMEDIGPFTDEQIGSVVRDVHKNSRETLARHVTVSPVVDGVEGAVTTLKGVGLDAKDTARLRLVGKVPPDGKVDAGVLRHRGWKVEKIELPTLDPNKRLLVIAPAEIEVE